MRISLIIIAAIIILSGCAPSHPQTLRIIVAGNIQGKIMHWEERNVGVIGTLARAGGLVQFRLNDVKMPTVLLMTGNTTHIDGDSLLLKAELTAKSAKMIGYEMNLPSSLEFRDSVETAKKRDSWGWPQVLSNVKPKEGVEPPVDYLPYYRFEPEKGWFVYVLNFIDKPTYMDSDFLENNYDLVKPADVMKEFARSIRPGDMIVVYYQTSLMQDLVDLYKAQEAGRIDLIILNRKLFLNISEKSKRDASIKDVNLMSVPMSVSDIQEAILNWDMVGEKWNLEQHQLQVGLNYAEHEEVKNLLKENESKVRELTREDSFRERIESFLPAEGVQRFPLESDKCAPCHQSSYDIWKETKHAKTATRISCDACHLAGDPHIRFEEWLATLTAEQRTDVLSNNLTRLVEIKPDEKKCRECHTGEFVFDTAWLKIKH